MRKTINKIIFLNIPLFIILGLVYGKIFLIDNKINSNNISNIPVILSEKIIESDEVTKGTIEINNISKKLVKETKPEYKDEIEISFLGDVMIGNRVRDAIEKNGQTFAFSGTSDYLSQKDGVVLNLETPVTETGKKFNKKYVFRANKEHLKGLKTFNDNLYANLANNHVGDYGSEGMKNTFQNLKDNDIKYFGAGNNIDEANSIQIMEIEGVKIGLIGQVCIWPVQYKAEKDKVGSSFFDKEVIKTEILQGRELGADIIVYNMHCGDEYKNGPNGKQTDYARFAIDNGADLVIGHHPHWYQPIEIYKNKLIFYSLGDYIFDIDRGRRTKEGIIANIIIKDKKIIKAEIVPIIIEGFGNTKFTGETKTQFILNELYEISKNIGKIETIKSGYIELK